jgi:hypothetical protein
MIRRPKPTSNTDSLTAYAVVTFFALVLWGIAIFVWYQAYLWFEIVSEPTFFVTLIALPLPYWFYNNFMTQHAAQNPPPAANGETPAAAPRPAPLPENDWISWLGNGETHRGTLVFLVIVFWSVFFWSFPGMTFQAFTFAAWGLITIIGTIMIRTLFVRQTSLPSQEGVSANNDKKSGK